MCWASCEPLLPQAGIQKCLRTHLLRQWLGSQNFCICNCCKWQVPWVRGKKFHHKLKDSLADQLEQNNVVARDLPSVAECSWMCNYILCTWQCATLAFALLSPPTQCFPLFPGRTGPGNRMRGSGIGSNVRGCLSLGRTTKPNVFLCFLAGRPANRMRGSGVLESSGVGSSVRKRLSLEGGMFLVGPPPTQCFPLFPGRTGPGNRAGTGNRMRGFGELWSKFL